MKRIENLRKWARRVVGTQDTQKRRILFLGASSSLVVLAVFGMLFFHAYESQHRKLRQTVLAQLYISELLEVFRGMTPKKLVDFLKQNPADPKLAPYFFCAHINLLDRKSDVLLNEDSFADLNFSTLDIGRRGDRANRYYQVQVVDLKTMEIQKDRCDQNPLTAPPLKPGEAFLVTVGLTWRPTEKNRTQLAQVSSSTVVGQ